MAKAVGVSKATVQRIWAAHGLKPHLTRTFKLSNDPHFEEKLVDVVGLYLDPPEHALVLCADEKTSIQAFGSGLYGFLCQPNRARYLLASSGKGTVPIFVSTKMGLSLLPADSATITPLTQGSVQASG